MMNKRGISTIVATVLIVLITVAAVTILWAALSPLIGENLGSGTGCFDAQNAVEIDANKQFTCFRDTYAQVRVERAANSDTLEGIELIVTNNGNTVANYFNETLPSANGAKIYNVTVPLSGTDVTVSVAAQILIDGSNTSCTASPPITLMRCS